MTMMMCAPLSYVAPMFMLVSVMSPLQRVFSAAEQAEGSRDPSSRCVVRSLSSSQPLGITVAPRKCTVHERS